MDGKVGSEELAPLPEAVQGRDDGAGEQPVQQLLHKGNLRLGNGGLVAQVRHLPGPKEHAKFLISLLFLLGKNKYVVSKASLQKRRYRYR